MDMLGPHERKMLFELFYDLGPKRENSLKIIIFQIG